MWFITAQRATDCEDQEKTKAFLDRKSVKNPNLFVQKTAVVQLKNPGLPEQFGQPWNAKADFWTAKITN